MMDKSKRSNEFPTSEDHLKFFRIFERQRKVFKGLFYPHKKINYIKNYQLHNFTKFTQKN